MKARTYRRALGLLELDRGKAYTVVAETLGIALNTLSGWAVQYREKGLKMLDDKPRPGGPIKISGDQRAEITALACSEPSEGYAGWHLRLLAEKAVEMDY